MATASRFPFKRVPLASSPLSPIFNHSTSSADPFPATPIHQAKPSFSPPFPHHHCPASRIWLMAVPNSQLVAPPGPSLHELTIWMSIWMCLTSFFKVPRGPVTVTIRDLIWMSTPSGMDRDSLEEMSFILTVWGSDFFGGCRKSRAVVQKASSGWPCQAWANPDFPINGSAGTTSASAQRVTANPRFAVTIVRIPRAASPWLLAAALGKGACLGAIMENTKRVFESSLLKTFVTLVA